MPGGSGIASGVSITKECIDTYEEMRKDKKMSYVIFKIENQKSIVVDCCGKKGASYNEFVERLTEAGDKGEGRYAVYDCDYQPGKAPKLVFISWVNDDTVKIRQKMLYTSSKKALQEKLMGLAADLQCNDLTDLAWTRLVETCASKY